MIKDREILKELDDLLDGAGDKFGPILLDELQNRLSKTVKIFDSELKEMLKISFTKYHNEIDQLNLLLNENHVPLYNRNEKDEKINDNSDIPEFIKNFDEKYSN